MATVTKPVALDETLQRVANALEEMSEHKASIINDDLTVKTATWSSEKINKEINDAKTSVEESKMQRVVLYLSQNNNVYSLKDKDNVDISFSELYNLVRDETNYIVILMGNSKLRPQYVSTSEIHCDGEDRDSQGTIFLRMIMTPNSLYYNTARLADKSDIPTLPSWIGDTKPTYTSDEITYSDSSTHTAGSVGEAIHELKDELDKKADFYYVTPEMFGAVGDGVTNDTDAFMLAMESGHPIFLSQKTYKCNITITKNGTVICGCGNKTIIVPYTTAFPAIRVNTAESVMSDLVTGVILRDFVIHGDPQYTTTDTHNGLFLYMCQSVHVINVRVERCYGSGIELRGAMDSTFERCEVIRCGNKSTATDDGTSHYSVVLATNGVKQSNAIKFIACRVEHSPRLLLTDNNTFQISFEGCKFETGCRGYSPNENLRPIYIRGQSHMIVFNNCFLTYNINTPTAEDANQLLDGGRYYLRVLLEQSLVESARRSNVSFNNCCFSSAPTQQVCWMQADNITIVGCEFAHSYGGDSRASINLGNHSVITACTIISCGGNRTFLLRGKTLIDNTLVIPDGTYSNYMMTANRTANGKVEVLFDGQIQDDKYCYFEAGDPSMYVEIVGSKIYTPN